MARRTCGSMQIERRRDPAGENDGVQIEQVLRDGQAAPDGLAHLLEHLDRPPASPRRALTEIGSTSSAVSAELAKAPQEPLVPA